jgi:Fe2+ or Zn2+ uptake regulation protein
MVTEVFHEHGFRVETDHLVLFGMCAACQRCDQVTLQRQGASPT